MMIRSNYFHDISLNLFILVFSCLTAFGQVDTMRLRNDLRRITGTTSYRHFMNPQTLDSVADFIFQVFKENADSVYYQDFMVNSARYRNVIGVYESQNKNTSVIGAHYDVCGMQQGADDNASGVVGLLELSRLLKEHEPLCRIELVAYSLEEPPFFRTENMGSFVHAKSLCEQNKRVEGMISLEMIGYFKNAKRTQDYPLKFLKLFYGSRGNYIALVNKTGKGPFARQFTKRFKRSSKIKAKSITAPRSIPGIDFSDHLNYWHFGYSALMITDTAFYRNKNYHEQTDTMETLDIVQMAMVIQAVFDSIIQ